MELNKLIKNVQQWSIDRGLDKADSKKQLLKLIEEYGELVQGYLKGNLSQIKDSIGDMLVVQIIYCQQERFDFGKIKSDVELNPNVSLEEVVFHILSSILELTKEDPDYHWALGTLNVCLKFIAKHYNNDIEECLTVAWNAIKDRKGKLVDGVWVKEEDLEMKEKTYEEVLASSQSPEQTLDDVVMRPNHYRGSDGLEALEVLRQFAPDSKAMEHAYWFNAGKYFLRHPKKNGAQDIEKCLRNMVWYSSCLSGKAKTAKLLDKMKEELEK